MSRREGGCYSAGEEAEGGAFVVAPLLAHGDVGGRVGAEGGRVVARDHGLSVARRVQMPQRCSSFTMGGLLVK